MRARISCDCADAPWGVRDGSFAFALEDEEAMVRDEEFEFLVT